MIRLSKLTDYAVVMLSHMAAREEGVYTAARLAERTSVPEPTAAKILKLLARAHILASHRGSAGGYGLARPAAEISIAEIIVALDGPIALAASLQVDASCHNAVLQEQVAWINGERDEYFFSLLKNPEMFDLTEGRMAIPSGAGLGVEIDEAWVEELSRGGHAWRAPHWRHEDGSIAEW